MSSKRSQQEHNLCLDDYFVMGGAPPTNPPRAQPQTQQYHQYQYHQQPKQNIPSFLEDSFLPRDILYPQTNQQNPPVNPLMIERLYRREDLTDDMRHMLKSAASIFASISPQQQQQANANNQSFNPLKNAGNNMMNIQARSPPTYSNGLPNVIFYQPPKQQQQIQQRPPQHSHQIPINPRQNAAAPTTVPSAPATAAPISPNDGKNGSANAETPTNAVYSSALHQLVLLQHWTPILDKLSPANKTAIWETCLLVTGFKNFNRSSFRKTLALWARNILPNMLSITVLFGAIGFLKHHGVLKNEFFFPNSTTPVFRSFIPSSNQQYASAYSPSYSPSEESRREEFLKFHRSSTNSNFNLEQFAVHQHSGQFVSASPSSDSDSEEKNPFHHQPHQHPRHFNQSPGAVVEDDDPLGRKFVHFQENELKCQYTAKYCNAVHNANSNDAPDCRPQHIHKSSEESLPHIDQIYVLASQSMSPPSSPLHHLGGGISSPVGCSPRHHQGDVAISSPILVSATISIGDGNHLAPSTPEREILGGSNIPSGSPVGINSNASSNISCDSAGTTQQKKRKHNMISHQDMLGHIREDEGEVVIKRCRNGLVMPLDGLRLYKEMILAEKMSSSSTSSYQPKKVDVMSVASLLS